MEILDILRSLNVKFPSLSERGSFLTFICCRGEEKGEYIVSISFRERFLPDVNILGDSKMEILDMFPSLSERGSFLTRNAVIYIMKYIKVSISFRERFLPDKFLKARL